MASWSPDDVRKQAPNWSLEGDGKLLEYMESISKTLDQKCNATLTNINKMLLSIDETNVALGNTTNKLLALQHAQFVENRVYDDDETIGSLADSSSSRDMNSNFVKKSNGEVLTPMGAIQLAIDNGINMLSDCYEKVSLDLDDDESDDDDVGVTNIVFQPKDPYIDKPLPFIIGSKEWQEKWHVGLLESDLESDNDNEVEEFSDTSSSNPSLSASIPSNAPTISESEGSVWGLLNTTAATPSNPKPQKDLFNNSSSSDEDDRGVSRNVNIFDPNDVISKHNQMKKDQTTEPENKPSIQPPIQPQQTIFREQQPTRKIVNWLDDEPPELDASSSSSSGSKPVTAQSNQRKPVNLFDESDDNDYDIFLTKKSNHVPSKPGVQLFNDTPPPVDEFKEITKTKPTKIVTNIFDDDNDDDDIGIVTMVKAPVPTVRSKITNIFDDDVPDFDDLDLFIESKKTKSKMTASSSSSSVSETKPIPVSSKVTKLFNDDDDDHVEHKDFDKILTKDTHITTPITPKEIAKPVLNLFSDDDGKAVEKEKAVPVPAARTVKPELGKFKPINLFEDDDDDDDNFSVSQSKPKESPLKSEIVKPNIPPNIFANDDHKIAAPTKLDNFEEAAFQIDESNKVKVASVKKLSPPKLFDDFEDDQDEFYSTPTTKKSEPPKLSEERVLIVEDLKKEEMNPITEVKVDIAPSKSINLFSDEPPDDDFDELFKGNGKKSSIKAPPEVPPLDDNDDEDWLVSSSKPSNIFDKFNEVPPTVTPPQSERKTSITTSALQFSSVRLFNDMPPSDDDIDDIPEPPPILSSSSSSKSHIYYDDTDSFNTVDTTKSIPVTTGYVINEEPPVDDYQDSSNKDEPDRTAPTNTNFKDKLNAFKNSNNNSNSTSSNSSSDSDKKTKIQPKKLNTNKLNINVGALLPGAKRPTVNEIIKKNSTTSSDENMSSAEEKINTMPKYNVIPSKAVVDGDGDKTILQSLQKSRAKIQVKRRPSTRQARHEVYRKSIIDDDGKTEREAAVIPTSKSEPISITQALLNLRNYENKSEFVEPPKITEIPKPKQQLPTSNKISLFDDNEFEISKPLPPVTNNDTGLPKKLSMFDDDDLIKAPKKSVEVTKPAEQVLKPPVIMLPEVNISSSTEKPQQTKQISLFDDDEDDDLFSKKAVKPSQRKPSPPTVKKTFKSAIFDDDEDADDLFAKPPPLHKVDVKPIGQQQKQPLFSSDEDNDLFGSVNVPSKKSDQPPSLQHKSTTIKKPPQTKSTTSNIKLFDSDDDNEGDLFGPSMSSSSSSTAKTTTSGKKSISQSLLFAKSTANNKLFDDSDGDDGNDDDIFKSKFVSSNRTTVPSSKSNTSLNKSDKKIIKSTEIIDNDPLADLLK